MARLALGPTATLRIAPTTAVRAKLAKNAIKYPAPAGPASGGPAGPGS